MFYLLWPPVASIWNKFDTDKSNVYTPFPYIFFYISEENKIITKYIFKFLAL